MGRRMRAMCSETKHLECRTSDGRRHTGQSEHLRDRRHRVALRSPGSSCRQLGSRIGRPWPGVRPDRRHRPSARVHRCSAIPRPTRLPTRVPSGRSGDRPCRNGHDSVVTHRREATAGHAPPGERRRAPQRSPAGHRPVLHRARHGERCARRDRARSHARPTSELTAKGTIAPHASQSLTDAIRNVIEDA